MHERCSIPFAKRAADLEKRLKQRSNLFCSTTSCSHHCRRRSRHTAPVNNKIRSRERQGIRSTYVALPEDTDESVAADYIQPMNQQNDLHGILIQSPLPKHIEEALTELTDPRKDVDGFHPKEFGAVGARKKRWHGSMHASRCNGRSIEVDLTGKKAVVLGRSFTLVMFRHLPLHVELMVRNGCSFENKGCKIRMPPSDVIKGVPVT